MTTHKYGRLTSSPIFVSRLIIEETASILARRCDSASVALTGLLGATPLTKPDKHVGGSSTDYFDTAGLSEEVLEGICDHLFEAEAEAVSWSGETTPEASRIAFLADLWHERNEVDVTVITTTSEQGVAYNTDSQVG